MIRTSAIPDWEPMPPHPGSLDDCQARGFDTDSAKHDLVPSQPLDETWQTALDAAVVEARRLRLVSTCDIEDCGEIFCSSCDERMSCIGPEPRACGSTCCDCPCSCETCVHVQQDMRADLLRKIERES